MTEKKDKMIDLIMNQLLANKRNAAEERLSAMLS